MQHLEFLILPIPFCNTMVAYCVYMCIYVPLYNHLGKADDTVETTPEHKRNNSEKVLPEDNSLGNSQ